MKRKALALLALASVALFTVAAAGAKQAKHSDIPISGAGSSLVNPLVQQFIPAIGTAFGYSLSYASVGSGTGIANITSRTVDFGASDAPLNSTQASACGGCVEIPWALSATQLSYNVPGVPNDLHLDGATVAGIYLGTITKWNDAAISKLNPKLTLPDLAITPVHRSDGSGDTYAFTDFLQRVSKTFQTQVGNNTAVNWPVGVGLAASGNAGVAGVIASTSGAIGYISAAYGIPLHLRVAAIQNAAGAFAVPGLKGIQAAAAAFTKPTSTTNGVEMHIVNPPKSAGKLAYPISTYTYIIVPSQSSKAPELKKLIFWALTQGDKKYGPKLVFAPSFPTPVLSAAEKAMKLIGCPNSGCV
ncbi:MAG TPA: phosphate ABC transporter substrate-binding protein PstS [Gaiellaceae bacterium]|jgi:phosphate transport system substrate-binding protein